MDEQLKFSLASEVTIVDVDINHAHKCSNTFINLLQNDAIPLKEDSSFEVLQYVDEDKNLVEQMQDSEDEEYTFIGHTDKSTSDNFEWKMNNTPCETIPNINLLSCNFASPVISAMESDQGSGSNSDINPKETLNSEKVYPVLVSEISSSEESMTSNVLNSVTVGTVPFNNQFKQKPTTGIKLESKLDESYETFHDFANGDIGCPSKEKKMFYNRNSSMEQNVKGEHFSIVSEIEHQRALELRRTAYEEQLVISVIESDQASVPNSCINPKETLYSEKVYPVSVSEINSSFEGSRTSNVLKNTVAVDIVPFNNQFKQKPTTGIELGSKLDESYETFHDFANGDIGCPSNKGKKFYNRNSSMEQNVKGECFSMVSEIEHPRVLELGRTAYEEQPENDIFTRLFDGRNCNKTISKAVASSVEFCNWFRNRKCVKRFIKRAKASFNSIANTVETEINQILGSEDPLKLTIIADELSSQAIEDAFIEVFRGQITASTMDIDHEKIPVLPMGHSAGLKAAEIKISYARQSNLILENEVAVSTSVVLCQTVSQRWQMMTIICLDDPNLNLNLHNFTTTIPIPNEYVKEAEQLTSSDYHLRDQGLAVNLEQTIEYMSGIKPRNMEEFLTGVNRYKLLKSATLALAGLYKKYKTGYTSN
ncbi:protein PRRC1-A [Caerostris darwini]|uniref:Protein PRRC1-A n=1 Tax=Caerostris darwini TaxID=1538125 RepID=A0AAV4U5S1_9ARAC|nr:protein PRRC1-A [Caerostris darwini]